jgi:triphosphoribosyl-dephospho-CoA synthetase
VFERFAARLLGIDPVELQLQLAEFKRATRDALEVAEAARAEVKQQRIDFELLYDKAANAVARLNQRTRKAAQDADAAAPAQPVALDDLNQAIREGRLSPFKRRA